MKVGLLSCHLASHLHGPLREIGPSAEKIWGETTFMYSLKARKAKKVTRVCDMIHYLKRSKSQHSGSNLTLISIYFQDPHPQPRPHYYSSRPITYDRSLSRSKVFGAANDNFDFNEIDVFEHSPGQNYFPLSFTTGWQPYVYCLDNLVRICNKLENHPVLRLLFHVQGGSQIYGICSLRGW